MKILSKLPENAIKINIVWDLIVINPEFEDRHKPKYGGKLYIKSALEDHYEEYPFDEEVSSEKINKYIQAGQLYFVDKNQQ